MVSIEGYDQVEEPETWHPLLDTLARDPAYRSYLSLQALEALVVVTLADALSDVRLRKRIEANQELPMLNHFREWLTGTRGTVPEIPEGAMVPTPLAIEVRRVMVECGALKFLALLCRIVLPEEPEYARYLERCQHLRAGIFLSRREVRPGSAYAIALDLARRAATGAPAPGGAAA